ncbi:hypothetical protein QTN25_005748 [Entamoeba marina]
MGITFGIYYVDTFLLVLSFIGTIGFTLALIFTFTKHPKQKYTFLSTCGLLSDYLASNLCTRIRLETSDIVFVGMATVSIFTTLTISAFFTRNLYAFLCYFSTSFFQFIGSDCSDPFLLSFILFEDCYDMFVTIAKVLASKKNKD